MAATAGDELRQPVDHRRQIWCRMLIRPCVTKGSRISAMRWWAVLLQLRHLERQVAWQQAYGNRETVQGRQGQQVKHREEDVEDDDRL